MSVELNKDGIVQQRFTLAVFVEFDQGHAYVTVLRVPSRLSKV
jgi:hypothetical protein